MNGEQAIAEVEARVAEGQSIPVYRGRVVFPAELLPAIGLFEVGPDAPALPVMGGREEVVALGIEALLQPDSEAGAPEGQVERYRYRSQRARAVGAAIRSAVTAGGDLPCGAGIVWTGTDYGYPAEGDSVVTVTVRVEITISVPCEG